MKTVQTKDPWITIFCWWSVLVGGLGFYLLPQKAGLMPTHHICVLGILLPVLAVLALMLFQRRRWAYIGFLVAQIALVGMFVWMQPYLKPLVHERVGQKLFAFDISTVVEDNPEAFEGAGYAGQTPDEIQQSLQASKDRMQQQTVSLVLFFCVVAGGVMPLIISLYLLQPKVRRDFGVRDPAKMP